MLLECASGAGVERGSKRERAHRGGGQRGRESGRQGGGRQSAWRSSSGGGRAHRRTGVELGRGAAASCGGGD